MQASKKIQVVQVAGVNLSPDKPKAIVETAKITAVHRSWDNKLIRIHDLKGGKSQVILL